MGTLDTKINSSRSDGYQELMHGLDVDPFLFSAELKVQRAWVKALGLAHLLSKEEVSRAHDALNQIEYLMANGKFDWKIEDEDIHMNIERHITERHGDLGKRIHLGRSRNDLIATTLRIFIAQQCVQISKGLNQLLDTLIGLANRDLDVLVPATTHLQAAQPVRMAHLWNAFATNFLSDLERFAHVKSLTMKTCPLGSAAVSGTHLEIDLEAVAKDLGFESAPLNSIQSTGDRDFVIEFGQAIGFFSLHVTRMCEEIIYWSSTPVGLMNLPKDWSSGSSMMPNKRNPDSFEVFRAKGKRLVSISQELMTMNLCLPLGYSSDFHEQKKTAVEMTLETNLMLSYLPHAISGLEVNIARAQELLNQGHILATDVANGMVSKGSNFRDAYRAVAAEISGATEHNRQIGVENLSFDEAVETRSQTGGTARAQVLKSTGKIRLKI